MDLLTQYPALPWIAAGSLITFVGTLAAIPVLIIGLREDYLVQETSARESFRKRHPALQLAGALVKNLLGAIFVVAGLVMLVLPGQGLLTLFIGLTLLDFPGKRRLERRIVQQEAVFRTINWIRRRAHRPPLLSHREAMADSPAFDDHRLS